VRVVVDEAHRAAYVVQRQPPQVRAAEQGAPRHGVDEAYERRGQGGLARARGAGDAEVLARSEVEVLQRCAELTAAAMPQLESMGKLDEYWIEINRLENTGDKSYRRILANLFSGEHEALEVMKLKDIVESLEGAIDAFEKVANIVEQIAVKES
jgi:hypothetical protein